MDKLEKTEWLERDGRVLQPIDGDAYSATLIIRPGRMLPDEIKDVFRRMAELRQPE